ncbi:MFS transporter [uncultured Shewanella sp.]|uniref:MFS transporter n=1 Tax=uncultured Shewanella sp. TaxID=173975 RepID=UPI002621D310|nr:MFS transporter [uncultured Shewanella sp.]
MTQLSARVFIFSIFLSFFATQFLLFAIPLAVLGNGGTVSSLGALLSIEWLPVLFAFPLSGFLLARMNGVYIARIAHVIRAGLCLLCYQLLIVFPDFSFFHLSMLAGSCAFLMGFVRMSSDSVISQAFKGDEENMAKHHSGLQKAELASLLLGASLAGTISIWISKETLLLVAGGIFILALFVTLLVPASRSVKKNPKPFWQGIRFGVGYIYHNKTLKGIVAINFSLNLMIGVIIGLNPIVVTQVFNQTDAYLGYLSFAGGIASLIALTCIPLFLKRVSMQMLGGIGASLCIIAGLNMVMAFNYYSYLLLFVLYLMGLALYNIYNRTERAKVIPTEDFGTVMGVFYVLNLVSLPLSGGVIYLAAEKLMPLNIILFVGMLTLVLSLSVYMAYLRPRKATPVSTASL